MKVWFITGCSSGFGRALAEHLLITGHKVFATARQPEALDLLQAQYPETCQVAALDVTDNSQIQQSLESALNAFGRIDVLVNNAGYGLIGALEEFDDQQMRANFETNFFGAINLIRAALPTFRAQQSGHIVNISAAAVISNYAGFSIYGASKWALEGATEALAAELKPLGIKVTMVQPGPFRTEFIARSLESAQSRITDYEKTSGKFAAYLKMVDGKQPGDPAKAAAAIVAAVESEAPPLRLVLGKYATDKVRKKLTATERELAAWEQVGAPTDF